MRNQQSGFTLIELVVVIVILGILAATAIPRFVDLSTDAGNAASNGVAGSLASATAVNYGAKLAGNAAAITLNGTNAATCTSAVLQPFVSGITFVAGPAVNGNQYVVSAGAGSCVGAPGTAITCGVTGFKGASQTATLICTGP